MNVPNASRVDIWIGRIASTRNGCRPAAWQGGEVLERDLGVEAAGEHPLVLVDEFNGDVDVVELEARQLGLVGVALRIEPRLKQVDDLHPALVPRPVLEELLLAGPNSALLHRRLNHLEPGCDLVRIRRRAVPAQQELADVRGYGVLAPELLREILLDEVPLEDFGCELIEVVELVTCSAHADLRAEKEPVRSPRGSRSRAVPSRSSSPTSSKPCLCHPSLSQLAATLDETSAGVPECPRSARSHAGSARLDTR